MSITPTNISKTTISPTGSSKSSVSTFVNVNKNSIISYTTIGSPIGLLLVLTYATSLLSTSGINLSKS